MDTQTARLSLFKRGIELRGGKEEGIEFLPVVFHANCHPALLDFGLNQDLVRFVIGKRVPDNVGKDFFQR
jgi:hypothetical protein